ncbi:MULTISPECIES: hypothetical protein [Arcicella]|uniref:Uncharacterized protein n=1 Tax=Arcicella aquatica TaxID=217141 RepID=A0ABU5QQ73_9BACT|nr:MULTISPECIES: hypothetical protein [Arcicella]MDR6560206.1 hypothetical protein [Arcicella sp. BE51]MDR6810188.1 hypothetical protein [Arcicella sp. BE140]MDR6821537.1 hypothetical protein [Arcicella sp. BE139]MEA5259232.1 hypothetical protein [Arcicella aquatica]
MKILLLSIGIAIIGLACIGVTARILLEVTILKKNGIILFPNIRRNKNG